jgi:hypothetical protein
MFADFYIAEKMTLEKESTSYHVHFEVCNKNSRHLSPTAKKTALPVNSFLNVANHRLLS